MWLEMFILAANLAQQEQSSIFGYAQENPAVLKGVKGEGMDLITFETFAYLRPHDDPMRTVPSLPLEPLGPLSK